MPGWPSVRKGLVRSLMPALRALSPRVGSRILDRIGRVDYSVVPGQRARYERAVASCRDRLGVDWNVPAVARELAGGLIRWRARDLLLDGRADGTVDQLFRVEGRTSLDSALGEGRGVVLLGNHFGAHLLPAHWLYRAGYALRLYMERPRSVSRFLASHFEGEGPLGQQKLFISRRSDPAESAGSILRATKALRSGMIVKVASDVRWAGAHTAEAIFLGRTHTFSTTWVILAAMTGAPVVPVFCRADRDGSFDLEFAPSFHVPSDAARDGRSAWWVQRSLLAIEERVRDDPASSNDYFFWTDQGVEAA